MPGSAPGEGGRRVLEGECGGDLLAIVGACGFWLVSDLLSCSFGGGGDGGGPPREMYEPKEVGEGRWRTWLSLTRTHYKS